MTDRKAQLKNLMKKERQDRTQKIDSPLAKYNSAGHLLCILCQTPVQADSLWDAHCKTKKHLEGLVALKQAKAAKQSGAVKRTASELPSEDEQPVKRAKVTPLSQTPAPLPTTEPEPESAALVTYDEEPAEDEHEAEEESGLDAETVAQLEREMMSEAEINKLIAQSRAAQQSDEIEVEVNLPEGFFDAQHAERAVKTVKQTPPPTTDTADNEWDKFQASLPVTGDDNVSNARPDEQEDDTRQDEDIDTEQIENEIHEELEQQQSLLSRLMEIKKKAAEQLSQPKKAVQKEVEASDEDDDDVDPFDWRAKGF